MKNNRLINEKSPYLLQHAYNPVDWYPWSSEAFEKAEKEDKPVFLSIGYSTCHWCHVMEHESFEDEEIAALMNDNFVSIKVDREERPDIDGVYMNVCRLLTGRGGWPLTIIMSPDKKPFFAGTYFPKETRFGTIGLNELIPQINDIWKNKRDKISATQNEIMNALDNQNNENGTKPDEKILSACFNELNNRFDEEFGGFGNAPKFPTPHNLLFLLRYWKKFSNEKALSIVDKTLTAMRKGGIYDHAGFGFHRYSTDREWLVPHFEKMLYDQALLANAYIEAFQATGKELFKSTAEEILVYVLRELTSAAGGFYSAQDADSEGEEGKYYLWNIEEIKETLAEDDASFIIKFFNMKEKGNWIDHIKGSEEQTNILHLKKSLEEWASELSISPENLQIKIESIRQKLFNKRKEREQPYKDDKILTDWNGLMISAFAKAYQVFGNPNYLITANRAAEFILNKMSDEKGRLLHRLRENEAGLTANIDDYAFMINALLDLYEADFNAVHLKKALKLNDMLLKHFWDDKNGGFYFSADYSEKLIVRQKEVYDGAVPSGNSVELLNLLRLGRITGNTLYDEKASRLSSYFSNQISKNPSAYSQFLIGLNFAFDESYEIVIVGNQQNTEAFRMVKLLRDRFIPNKIILLKDEEDAGIEEIAPFTKDQKAVGGASTAYVCRNFKCSTPVTAAEEMIKLID